MKNTQNSSPYLIIFSLWLLVFSSSSQIMIIAPILPRISEQLQISQTLLGTLVTAYAVMVGVFALISGPISDKIGRRKILMIGTGGMTIALFFHYFVIGYLSFLLVRGIAGAAGGVLSGAAVAYVGDYFPYERRGWASGWVMSGIAAGQILGIPIGTLMAEHFGFRAPFLFFASTMFMAYILIFTSVPQPDVELHKGKVTFKSSIKKYRQLLRNPDIVSASLAYVLMFLSVSIYVVFLPTWLETTFGVSGNAIASLFFVGGIASVLAGPQAGKWSDNIGRKRIIILSCLGIAVVMLFTTVVITAFWLAYILFFVAMVLVSMRISPFQALTTELVTSRGRGTLMSLLIAIGQVGYGLGGAVAGPAYVEGGYLSNTILASIVGLIMTYVVWKHIPEPELATLSEKSPG